MMFWKALEVPVNSPYKGLGPILVVGKYKSCELGLWPDRMRFAQILETGLWYKFYVRSVGFARSTLGTAILAVPAESKVDRGSLRTNSLSGMSPMPIVEAVRLFPAPFLWHRSSTPKGLATVPPG